MRALRIVLALLTVAAAVAGLRSAEDKDGKDWVVLFNGRDTSGVRGIGGTYDPRNAKGVTRIHLKATRIEARSADTGNRSRKD